MLGIGSDAKLTPELITPLVTIAAVNIESGGIGIWNVSTTSVRVDAAW